jgi:hypothetical protein
MERRWHPYVGWGLLAAWVVGYDTWALTKGMQTLSAAFWEAKNRRRLRAVVAFGWLGLTWHLLAGDRQFVNDRYRRWYRQFHPFWVAHDRFVIYADRVTISPPDQHFSD